MVSGVGVTLLRLTEALQARGHQVRAYSATYPLPENAVDRPEVHRSPSIPLFLYPDVQWAFPRMRDVVEDLSRFQPDVVHIATEFTMGLAGLKAARQLNLPIIASAHTDYEKYAPRYGVDWVLRPIWGYLRWFYGHAHRVLCPTQIYEAHLQSRGVVNTGIWTRGLDPEAFHPRFRDEAYRTRFGVGPDDLLITYVGRLAREKNLMLLLDAWQALAAERAGAQLVLVGRGPLQDEIRARNIPGIHVPGLMQGRELATAYASADIFVFPSTTETFGNSLLEAMGSGLPSVTAAAGGLQEFAKHGDNAWLVAPGSTEALTGGLRRLLGDPGLRQSLAEGGLRTSAERSWSAVYDRLVADYQAAVDGKRITRAA